MLEINIQCSTLFKLTVLHNYFSGDTNQVFSIVPTQHTQQLANRSGMVLKTQFNEMSVAYDNPDNLLTHLEEEQPLKLSFYIYSSNQYFKNFTNFPLSKYRGNIFYFNNLNKKNEKSGLHEGEYVTEKELFLASEGGIAIEPKGKELNIEIQNQANQVVLSETTNSSVPHYLNMNGLEEGLYSLYENKKQKSTFVYIKPKMTTMPIGFCEILIDGKMKADIIESIKNQEDTPEYEFEVNFEKRSTYWKYFIVPKYEGGLKNLKINTGDEKLNFEGPKEIRLPNGKQAYQFISDKPLGLYEKPTYNFQLSKTKNTKDDRKEKLMQILPFPSIDSLKPESKDSNSKVYSEIVVYV